MCGFSGLSIDNYRGFSLVRPPGERLPFTPQIACIWNGLQFKIQASLVGHSLLIFAVLVPELSFQSVFI